MNDIFKKVCIYYLTGNSEFKEEEIKSKPKEEIKKINKKAKNLAKKIKEETKKKGFEPDFEGFCELLEYYINKKENLSDKEKKENLKLLMTLSELHEINLREELERYVSYKKVPISEEGQKEIFNKFCNYNLTINNDIEEYNKLKDLAKDNNLDFKELQKQSIIFIEELKILAEKLGFDLEKEDFETIMSEYLSKKSYLSDIEKTKYLKLLLYLSDILKINLREELAKKISNNKNSKINSLKEIISNLSNPLENDELLNKMLKQRYHNGYFEISELNLTSENDSKKEYDYKKMQADLTYKLYRIFLEKFNNYAFEDLNEFYLNLITESDLQRLENITREEIYAILTELNKRENSHFICKKYKLTNNLFDFINLSTKETTNINNNYIGTKQKTLFNAKYSKELFEISLYGLEFELNIVLNEYIKKCVESNLNYSTNGIINDGFKYKCIIYASYEDFNEKINIVNETLKKLPNITKKLFKPSLSSGTYNNSIYGINHIGINQPSDDKYIDYNMYFNNISEISYYRVLAKLIKEVVEDKKAKDIINDFINLENINLKNIDDIMLTEYNGISFNIIKDLINQYIPLVSSTLNIYMSDDIKRAELIKELKKSMLYLSNIVQGRAKKAYSNIAISKEIEQIIKNN